MRIRLRKDAAARRELILIAVLTLLVAVMDITGIPSAFFVNIQVADIEPFYFTLMINFLIIGVVAFLFLRLLCPSWRLGFTSDGLLLNLIEKLLAKRKDSAPLAVVISSLIFGAGHIFGALGQSPLVIVSKVLWTVGMGMFFGMVYKKTGNLWLPVIIHFFVDICALPYCFSSVSGYADLTLYILVPVYTALGVYSFVQMKRA